MPKILIASHGTFASGIQSSLNVLLGKSENIKTIDAYLDEDNFEEKLEEYFRSVSETEQVIMLSDLYGGSVNQKMTLRLTRPNTFLVTGMNLALALELALKTEDVNLETLEVIVNDSREALKRVEIESISQNEEDDFFGGDK